MTAVLGPLREAWPPVPLHLLPLVYKFTFLYPRCHWGRVEVEVMKPEMHLPQEGLEVSVLSSSPSPLSLPLCLILTPRPTPQESKRCGSTSLSPPQSSYYVTSKSSHLQKQEMNQITPPWCLVGHCRSKDGGGVQMQRFGPADTPSHCSCLDPRSPHYCPGTQDVQYFHLGGHWSIGPSAQEVR